MKSEESPPIHTLHGNFIPGSPGFFSILVCIPAVNENQRREGFSMMKIIQNSFPAPQVFKENGQVSWPYFRLVTSSTSPTNYSFSTSEPDLFLVKTTRENSNGTGVWEAADFADH